MKTFIRGNLLIFLLILLVACGGSPETKKVRHFENGDKFLEQKQYREAIIEYGNVIKIDPNNKQAYKKIASVFILTQNPREALSFFQKAKGIDPDDLEVRLKVAQLQVLLDKAKDGRSELEFILEKEPQNEDALSLLAETARTQPEISDAVSRLQAVKPDAKDLPRHNLTLAILALKRGDLRGAENYLLDALQENANFPEAHTAMGDLASIKKDYLTAEAEYKAASDMAPGPSPIQIKLADFYLSRNKQEEARQVLTGVLEKSPEFLPALNRMARIALAQKDLTQCSEILDRVLKKSPDDVEARITQSQLLLARNDASEAKKILRELTAARPDLPFPKYLLGLAYMRTQEMADARTALSAAIDQNPNLIDAAIRLAEIDIRTGYRKSAYSVLTKVLERDPGNLEACILLPDAVESPAEIAQALKLTEQPLLLQFRDNPSTRMALVSLYLRKNELKKAEELLNQWLAGDPDSVEAHAAMSKLFLQKGDPAQAEREIAKAAWGSPEPSIAKVILAELYYGSNRQAEGKKILTDILAASPDFLPASFSLAGMAFQEKDYAESTRLLQEILKTNPGTVDALVLMGQNDLAQGRLDEAIRNFQEARKLNPSSFPAHFFTGLAYFQKRDLPNARTALEEAFRINPESEDVRVRLAELDMASGAFQQAVQHLEFLSAKGLKDNNLYVLLGSAYLGNKDAGKAAGQFRKYVEAAPDDPRGKHMLGVALKAQGKNAEALKCFEDALKLSPAMLDSLSEIVAIDVSEKKSDAALSRVQKQIELSPNPGLYQLLGKVYVVRQQYEDAEKTFFKAIDLEPGDVSNYMGLIQVYNATKRYDLAISRIEELLKINPKNTAALMLLGMVRQQMNDFPKARDAYEALLSITPSYTPAANNLAYIYCEYLGDVEKALRLAQTARAAAPQDPNVADTLGWTLYKKGNFDWALTYIKESADKMPDNAEVQYHLGMTYYQLGNSTEAKKALTRALEGKQDFQGMAEAKKTLAEIQ